MSAADDKVRLGGMALQNGILVHSFDHWAVAVRDAAGEVRLASGRKPDLPAIVTGTPLLRGVARMFEVAYLLPTIKRRLPEARLPMESAGMGAALAGSAARSARPWQVACPAARVARSFPRAGWWARRSPRTTGQAVPPYAPVHAAGVTG